MAIKTYRIFLASSYELLDDRKELELFINRQNNVLKDKNVFLQLVIWEDIGDAIYPSHKQDHYNEELKTCDIFIGLYWTKMGKYTEIEFDRALAQFRYTNKHPKLFMFEKTTAPIKLPSQQDNESLLAFKKKLSDAGQFPTQYSDYNSVINLFKKNLDRLFEEGYLKFGNDKKDAKKAECLYTDGHSVPVDFLGRESELRTIKEMIEASGSTMLINAEGGIGKTSLAAKYWEESIYDYKYNAWLFCENGIVQELKKLAPKLKIDLNGLSESEQIRALKSGLLNISEGFLLVLDNANEAKDIDKFKNTFRGLNWHVLITSRCSGVLEAKHELHINHLLPDIAKILFKSNYTEDTVEFDTLLDRLLSAIDYHTLLVEIFSKNMRQLCEFGETLSNFLDQLETNGLYLKERSFKIVTDYANNVHKEAVTTDDIIEILYDFSRLENVEQYYLINIAFLPAVNHELIFLSSIFEIKDKFTFGATIRSLANKGWLSHHEKGYRINPVVQRLTLQKNEKSLREDCSVLVRNLNKKLANDGIYLTALSYLEAVPFVQLIETITKSLKNNYFIELGVLNENAFVYYLAVGDILQAQIATRNLLEIGEVLNNEFLIVKATGNLAVVNNALGFLDEAMMFYQKEYQLKKKLFAKYPNVFDLEFGLALCYQNIGNSYTRLQDFKKATMFYRKFNRAHLQLVRKFPNNIHVKNGLAISYQHLGLNQIEIGNSLSALTYFKKYHKLKKELVEYDSQNIRFKDGLAISYKSLGNAYLALNKIENALNNYKEYYELENQLNKDFPYNLEFAFGVTDSLYKIGEVYELKIEIEIAKSYYLKVVSMLERLVAASPHMADYQNNLSHINSKLVNLNNR